MARHNKIVTLFLVFGYVCLVLSNCAETRNDTMKQKFIVNPIFQQLLDSAQVTGAILIYDAQKDIYYSNDFEWAKKGQLPASTFKVPHAMIALECGVVENDTSLLKWDGKKRAFKVWEQDLTLHDAFHFSCVPCYQEVARKIGAERMNKYLKQFDYGNMVVDTSNMDDFWLEGDSRINQFQQIDFLNRFYNSKLPISSRTLSIMKRLMVVKKSNQYQLSGKTGWSIRNDTDNGWYIGFVEKGEQLYYFATNIEPKEDFEMKYFAEIRKKITHDALRKMKIME